MMYYQECEQRSYAHNSDIQNLEQPYFSNSDQHFGYQNPQYNNYQSSNDRHYDQQQFFTSPTSRNQRFYEHDQQHNFDDRNKVQHDYQSFGYSHSNYNQPSGYSNQGIVYSENSPKEIQHHIQHFSVNEAYQKPAFTEYSNKQQSFQEPTSMYPHKQYNSVNYSIRPNYQNQLQQGAIVSKGIRSVNDHSKNASVLIGNAHNEPTHIHQIGRPQVLAKTSSDGEAVAVFGVVAQVAKSTSNEQSRVHMPMQQQEDVNGRSLFHGGQAKSYSLSPIQENPEQYNNFKREFEPNLLSHQRYHVSTGQDQNLSIQQRQSFDEIREPAEHRYSKYSKSSQNNFEEFHRHKDVYRDEYTDSGYGSTLTERSYEGPTRMQPPQQYNKNVFYGKVTENVPPQIPQSNAVKRLNYQSCKQENYNMQQSEDQFGHSVSYRDYGPTVNQNFRPPERSFLQYESTHNAYQPHKEESRIDANQIKSVKSVKQLFDKPGSTIPLPPASSSFGANHYNTRPIPPRPRPLPENNQFQYAQQKPYQSFENSQLQTNFYQKQSDLYSNQRSSNFLADSHKLNSNFNSSDQITNLPQQENRPFNPSKNQSLPYFQPPPEHSQSMNNLDDLQPTQPSRLSEGRSRYSYSNKRTDNDMVVGVRFEKKSAPFINKNQFHSSSAQTGSGSLIESNNVKIVEHPYQQQNRNDDHRAYYGGYSTNPFEKRNAPTYTQQLSPTQTYPVDQRNFDYPNFPYEKRLESNSIHLQASNNQQYSNSQGYSKPETLSPNNQKDKNSELSFQQQWSTTSGPPLIVNNRGKQVELNQQPPSGQYNMEMQSREIRDEENHVPDVVRKSYGQYSQSTNINNQPQSSEEWPAPPSNLQQQHPPTQQQPRSVYNQAESSLSQPGNNRFNPNQKRLTQQDRQDPTGGNNFIQSRQGPSHPFDPADDDSSDEVDVDAPTPPISRSQHHWDRQRFIQETANESRTHLAQSSDQRPITTGQRYHQTPRQPGDGYTGDQLQINAPLLYQSQQASQTVVPKKPSRNSLKNANTEKEKIIAEPPEVQQELNHHYSKDRARLVKAGKIPRKPPSRSNSSNRLPEVQEETSNSNYEITVTSTDLERLRVSQPIKVQQPKESKELNNASHRHHQNTLNEATQTDDPAKQSIKEASKKSKLVYKTLNEDHIRKRTDLPLPNILEPSTNEHKLPPTYTGSEQTPKPQSYLTTDLLGQFTSAREDAMRAAAKKQTRALHTVQAAVRMRKTDQSSNSKKENREIYNQSKPKHIRKVDESRVADDRRERSDFGRSERTRTSERLRNRSPDRRDRDGSPNQSRDIDRDHRSRKSNRDCERVSNTYRDEHDEAAYRHSSHHRKEEPPYPSKQYPRNGEPDWVEEVRKKRAAKGHSSKRKDGENESKYRQKKEFDFDQYQRDVNQATSYNSDFEQPPRKQIIPTKLLSKGRAPPVRRSPPNNSDWIRNLKEKNKQANKIR